MMLMLMQLQATAAHHSMPFPSVPFRLKWQHSRQHACWSATINHCGAFSLAAAVGGGGGAGVYWLLTAPPSTRSSCLFRRRRRCRCHCSCLVLLFRLTLRLAFMLHGASHCIYVGARIKQLPQLPAARLGCSALNRH